MAIYHCHMQIINRASGRSSVAAAGYRSGAKLLNERDGIIHDYTRKIGVIYSKILLPENAPPEYANREKLWNAVEKSEKRKDAQTAREIEVALPRELSRGQQIELVRSYISENFISQGMIADFSLHDKQDGNPHAHVMLTLRDVDENGFGKKQRSWNDRQNAELWRDAWAKAFNHSLEKIGVGERVDHRSYRRQGLDISPTRHLGPGASGLERRGIPTDRGEQNRQAQKARQRSLELLSLEREKAGILAQEKARLSRLKNRYLEKFVELGERKAAARRLHAQADDCRARARSITELAAFIDQTRERSSLIGKELQSSALGPARRLILERQQAQLGRSLQEDRALLFSRFELDGGQAQPPRSPGRKPGQEFSRPAPSKEQIHERARQLLGQAERLDASLSDAHGYEFLDKLLEKLFRLILEAFLALREYLGPELSLQSLEPFAGKEPLSPEQEHGLQAAQERLQSGIAQALSPERTGETLAREQSPGLSRGH